MTITNTLAALSISGKGSKARKGAFSVIAEQAYSAETGKTVFIATLTQALGNAPTDEQTAFARLETTIGIAAVRMPASELRAFKTAHPADRIAAVRSLVLEYQAPSTAVSGKVPALRRGKKGWRSAAQHRIIRNAEDRASKYLAEVGAGNAKSEADKNATKPSRVPAGKPTPRATGSVGKDAAPSHAELIQPAKPVDGVAFAGQMLNMLSTAMQYANKHAKVQPIEYNPVTEGLIALHKLALKQDAAMHVRIAAQQAELEEKADRKRA